jgi:hypothetical protein
MEKPTKLLSKLERVTRTIEYYVGFDLKANKWRIMRFNGHIFGSFLKKESAKEYAKVAATIEYRKSQNSKETDFTIDGIYYNDIMFEEMVINNVECDLADDEFLGGDCE